jgi:limonene-1,2-epoxide hydrolase
MRARAMASMAKFMALRWIAMRTNEEIVRDFIAAWSRLDVDEIVEFFTPDGTYHNMMNKPISGRENVRKFIGGFIKDWTQTSWDVLNIVSKGDIVMVERLDKTRLGAKSVDLPCCGVFELTDGKIKLWRDYFDLATYTRAFVAAK